VKIYEFWVGFYNYSSEVYASISLPFRRLRSTGSARISTPGPTLWEPVPERWLGNIYRPLVPILESEALQPQCNRSTNLGARPPQSIRSLIGDQFAKAQHQPVDEW
jgi:hypothetical protein